MGYYTNKEKAQILKWYYQGNSALDCVKLFIVLFEDRRSPTAQTVMNIIHCFEKYSCLCDCKYCRKKDEDAPQKNEERDIAVCSILSIDDKKSTRAVGEELGLSKTTVAKIWKQNDFKCFKYEKHQQILPEDPYRRMEFCDTAMEKANQENNFIKNILFTDESSFPLNGKHNPSVMRYWSQTNQHRYVPTQTQFPQKLNVWAGILGDHIIGPFFIDGSLDSQKYLSLLQDNILPAVRALPNLDLESVWYQQDGCPAHNAIIVRQFLEETFQERLMSGFGTIKWPPRSPDLSPNDFFLWGFLKTQIYSRNRPENLQQLRQRIVDTCANISPQMLENTRADFYNRLGYCLASDGGIFENMI